MIYIKKTILKFKVLRKQCIKYKYGKLIKKKNNVFLFNL